VEKTKKVNRKPLYGLLAAMVVLCPLGLLASGDAWGEWDTEGVKSLVGYIPQAFEHGINYSAIAADYSVPGINEVVGYIISAIAGAAIIIIIFKIVSSIKKNNTSNT
jgi:cobalt/nickel transport system permease protein